MKVLDGVKILDLGAFVTGPYAAMLLADLGAQVLKVERPGMGDPFRAFAQGAYSSEFQAHNRNKRSMTLDYAGPEGREILFDLVRRSDVLVMNSRPKVPEKLGIGYDELHKINPRLIFCFITGFGLEGPYSAQPAFDTVGQCLSGWLTMFHDGEDPRIAGPAVCDMITGFFAAYGILGALYERERSGVGRRIDVNMVESMLAFGTEPIGRYFRTGEISGPYTRGSFSQAFVFVCSDGKRLGIHMSSPQKFWEGLLEATQRQELAHDPRFIDRPSRVTNYADLGEELRSTFATRPRAEWLDLLTKNDVPSSPLYELDELESDPHIQALAPFEKLVHPTFGAVTASHRPVRYDGDRRIDMAPPPALGEHTDDVLRELGIDQSRFDDLRARKIV